MPLSPGAGLAGSSGRQTPEEQALDSGRCVSGGGRVKKLGLQVLERLQKISRPPRAPTALPWREALLLQGRNSQGRGERRPRLQAAGQALSSSCRLAVSE